MSHGENSRFAKLTKTKAADTLSRVPPRSRFTLAAHPRQWFADPTLGRLLPRLIPLTHTPGVNGAVHNDGEAGFYNLERKVGYRRIPEDVTAAMPDGPPMYLMSTDVVGGVYWHTFWETPIAGATRSKTDLAGFRAFQAWLVDSGNVAPIEEHVIEERVDELERHHAAERRKAITDPVAADRAAEIEAELAIWRAALETAPESKPRRRRKATA